MSLAEIMVSIVVLASLSVLMVGVIPATIIGLRSASERATATLLVQAALEQTRKQDFGDLQSISFTRDLNGREYKVRTVVTNATGSDGSALDPAQVKSVEVIVEWRSKGGDKVERFEAIVARTQ
jgi:Tfp pilus assembly protein PilV